jgi:cAMP-specific phosphodiesterase 4
MFDMCEYTKQNPVRTKEFINFVTLLKYKYNKKSNPFHNFTHGVNVMHGCFIFSHHPKFGFPFNDL